MAATLGRRRWVNLYYYVIQAPLGRLWMFLLFAFAGTSFVGVSRVGCSVLLVLVLGVAGFYFIMLAGT